MSARRRTRGEVVGLTGMVIFGLLGVAVVVNLPWSRMLTGVLDWTERVYVDPTSWTLYVVVGCGVAVLSYLQLRRVAIRNGAQRLGSPGAAVLALIAGAVFPITFLLAVCGLWLYDGSDYVPAPKPAPRRRKAGS